MTTAPAPGFHVHPDAIARKNTERSDKLESTAIECMKLAVDHCKNHNKSTSQELTDVAEWIWRWTTTDDWPKPEGLPR